MLPNNCSERQQRFWARASTKLWMTAPRKSRFISSWSITSSSIRRRLRTTTKCSCKSLLDEEWKIFYRLTFKCHRRKTVLKRRHRPTIWHQSTLTPPCARYQTWKVASSSCLTTMTSSKKEWMPRVWPQWCPHKRPEWHDSLEAPQTCKVPRLRKLRSHLCIHTLSRGPTRNHRQHWNWIKHRKLQSIRQHNSKLMS